MELASRRFSKTTIDRHRLFSQKGSNRNRLAAGVVWMKQGKWAARWEQPLPSLKNTDIWPTYTYRRDATGFVKEHCCGEWCHLLQTLPTEFKDDFPPYRIARHLSQSFLMPSPPAATWVVRGVRYSITAGACRYCHLAAEMQASSAAVQHSFRRLSLLPSSGRNIRFEFRRSPPVASMVSLAT